MNGYIKLFRKFIEWEWYSDINVRSTFIHCILVANWKDKRWRGQVIKRGSFITSQSKLSEEIGISKKALRIALGKLKDTGEIEVKGTQWTQITVCNYDSYQGEETERGTQRAHKGHTKGTQRATTEEVKNNKKSKNSKNINTPHTPQVGFEEFWDVYGKKVDRAKCERKWGKLKYEEQLEAVDHAKRYRQHHQDVDKLAYLPGPYRYLNNKMYRDEQMPYEYLNANGKPKHKYEFDENGNLIL